ncbi:MAG TPA: guanine deaminase [Candidatus Obscuribacter sp.]|nr:guanine deaminase [Candidatus Obscuribacter sp.]HMW90639.1 guanine deaminase [Candidatus Obscuribacter sp.]HMX45692.1 guanine deaminase [Candidatus Obscuribacter sp.]HMY52294.1 guanine deaminase [Candidatus Obscuribacter sp.]HND05313.1 guanine deaminase [Candidatus Obscuribacter sp.]
MSSIAAYKGHIVSPISASGSGDYSFIDYPRGLMVVTDGKLTALGDFDQLRERSDLGAVLRQVTIEDFGKRLIMPGLIDMHLHLPQVTQTAKSGQHLLAWLNRYIFPAECKFSDIDYARRIARWFFAELAANGTTLSVVFTTIHKEACNVAFEEAARTHSRVIMGKVMMDLNAPAALCEVTQESLTGSMELARKWHNAHDGLLQYAFTPRFGVTSTPELLSGTGELWKRFPGTYMHTHLAEAREEIQTVAGLFPEARSYMDMYDRFGLAGQRSVFAHAIHLDDGDLDCIKHRGAALAHCPSSNFFLKSGVFAYNRVRQCGCLFGLGSDVAAGPHMSLFEVMKDANFIQPDDWIEPRELIYRSTLGGARALYMDGVVGSLEVGKEADFVVLDPSAKTGVVDDILDQPTDEILSCLVFLGDDRIVERTYVRGRLIFSKALQETGNLASVNLAG